MKPLALVILGAAACGTVQANPDASPIDTATDPRAPGDYQWVRSLASLQTAGIVDGPGGLTVAGQIIAPCDLGHGAMTPAGKQDQVIADFNASDGELIYAVHHGGAGDEGANVHDVDSSGAPMVFGSTSGTTADIDLGLGRVDSGGDYDGYVGRYEPAAPAWVQRLVGPGRDMIVSTAPGLASTIYATGMFEAGATFNGGTLTNSGKRDVFLTRISTYNGAVELMKTYGGTGSESGWGVASNGTAVFLAGDFDEAISFGGTAPALTTNGQNDVFVAKLDTAGAGLWAVRLGGTESDRDPRIALDTAGDLYIAGTFTGQIGIGGINLIANGPADMFVAKLRGADGSVVWATSVSSNGFDGARAIAVDRAGHVTVVGALNGTFDDTPPLGGLDGFVASFEAATGALRFRKVYATTGDDYALGVAYGTTGDLYVSVHVGAAFDFGQPVLGPAGGANMLIRMAP